MEPPTAQPRRSDRFALWLILPLTIALGVILVVFYAMYTTTTVDGESMLPTLKPADHVLVTKGDGAPSRGDVVVVHIPDSSGQMHDLVKRVVAVGGDTVSVTNDIAYVNGKRESNAGLITDPKDPANLSPTRVPKGAIFLLGDNRPVSYDSRFFGAVPVTDVQGKVVAVFAPVTRVRTVR